MPLSDYLLYQLSRRWPDRMASYYGDAALDQGEPGTDEYNLAYARFQFNRKVAAGLGQDVWERDVLELGCGHGGICAFVAVAGARSVIGVDVSPAALDTARGFIQQLQARFGAGTALPITFREMPAERLDFPEGSFDLVIADNLLEHVNDPGAVMREAYRVLRPKGRLLVPNVPSIFSRDGLHLKYGLNVPWANLVFSEATIVRALKRIAEHDPRMHEFYPGLAGASASARVRDVRRYKDLNGITYGAVRALAREAGFAVESFQVSTLGYASKVVGKLPIVKQSRVMDVLSNGAAVVLRKAGGRAD